MNNYGSQGFGDYTPTKRGTLAEMFKIRRNHGGFGFGLNKNIPFQGDSTINVGSRVELIPFSSNNPQLEANRIPQMAGPHSSHRQYFSFSGQPAEKRSRCYQYSNQQMVNQGLRYFDSEPLLGVDKNDCNYYSGCNSQSEWNSRNLSQDSLCQFQQPTDFSAPNGGFCPSQSLLSEESLTQGLPGKDNLQYSTMQGCYQAVSRDIRLDPGYFSQSSQFQMEAEKIDLKNPGFQFNNQINYPHQNLEQDGQNYKINNASNQVMFMHTILTLNHTIN